MGGFCKCARWAHSVGAKEGTLESRSLAREGKRSKNRKRSILRCRRAVPPSSEAARNCPATRWYKCLARHSYQYLARCCVIFPCGDVLARSRSTHCHLLDLSKVPLNWFNNAYSYSPASDRPSPSDPFPLPYTQILMNLFDSFCRMFVLYSRIHINTIQF